MADEITVTCSFVAQKGSGYARSVPGFSSYTVDMVGSAIATDTPTLATTVEQTLDFSSAAIGTVGMVFVMSNSTLTYDSVTPTNYLELSYGTGGSFAGAVFATLRPGEAIAWRTKQDLVYVKAVTASSHTISVIACEV